MTPQEIAEVRPRLAGFAFEMLGGLTRKDQRAAGELYVRGLLTDGQRKSMQPMAARLGADHQRLQQFVTSSSWDYRLCGGMSRGGSRRSGQRVRSSSTTPASRRTGMRRRACRGSIPGRWARRATARPA
jgi:hypothetical protein